MSYEVTYKFYEKLEDSFDYDRSNPLSYKKIYGKLEEDYTLDSLVPNIMQQMARRDIFVFDVEIYEFQKKKITFKQSKADLIVNNKKFSTKTVLYDAIQSEEENTANQIAHTNIAPTTNNNVLTQTIPTAQTLPAVNLAPVLPSQANMVAKNNNVNKAKRVIKFVTFDPPNPVVRAKFPYKFTPNKKYPVFSERLAPNGIGMVIDTIDDLNNEVKVPDELFVSLDVNLIGDQEAGFSTQSSGLVDSTLDWKGVVKDDIPSLR